METEEILAEIKSADMILVGLGEDFDDIPRLRNCPEYARGKELLQEAEEQCFLPMWNEYCSAGLEDIISSGLEKLAGILEKKNYFVISTATDTRIASAPWRKDRLVMPCGTTARKQCRKGCGHPPKTVSAVEREKIFDFFGKVYAGGLPAGEIAGFENCPECGAAMAPNTVFTENYDERGYLEQWGLYTKWLQGTLNRRLIVLELGVGMRFPSVIRWPFEKTAFFNRKAAFIRVHEKLYQITEELSERGYGISQNAIAWLERL